jgi:hypothetical protein
MEDKCNNTQKINVKRQYASVVTKYGSHKVCQQELLLNQTTS